MRLSVGTNFDAKLLDGIKDTHTEMIYGKLPDDIIGGGRPAFLLPKVTPEDLENHVKLAHAYGFEFSYLFNTACMGNEETQQATNRKIFELLDWLKQIKVDWITVVFPYFVDIIRKYAPEIKIALSTFADVVTLQKALQFERMGVNQITLPEGLNRNFKLLRLLKKKLSCDLQLIATNTCLISCPYRNTHTNFLSHASKPKGLAVNYCMLRCTQMTVESPAEIIKSGWIRPEDLHYYEEIGIDKFKLTSRMMTTRKLLTTVHAYNNRKYDGDLGDILNFRVKTDFMPPNKEIMQQMMKTSMDGDAKTIGEFNELIFARRLGIDNKKLGDFLSHFVVNEPDCLNMQCGSQCKYCYEIANKSVSFDKGYNDILDKKLQEKFDLLASGKFFDNTEKTKWEQDAENVYKTLIENVFELPQRENVKLSIRLVAESSAEKKQCPVSSFDVVFAVNKFCNDHQRKQLDRVLKEEFNIEYNSIIS